jgi:hypothetical protein
MSLVTLFTQTKRNIGGIQIDAVLNESENNSITVTNNPIETGAYVNDHAILRPRMYRLEGVVSDTERGSLTSNGDNSVFQNAATNLIDNLTGNVFNPISNSSRSKDAYNLLLELMNEREPFDIQTALSIISNVIITNITTNKEKTTGRALHFIAELTQLVIVNNESVQLKPQNLRNGSTKQQATPETDSGRKSSIYVDNQSVFNYIGNSNTNWI